MKIHVGNELTETLSCRLVFGALEEAGQQDLSVVVLEGADATRDDAEGTVVARGRTSEAVTGE